MSILQNKVTDIAQDQKETATKNRAKGLGFWYINFSEVSPRAESLNIIPEEIAKELDIICFFSIQKKIRIAVVNENDGLVKNYIQKLKWDWFSVNINLCTKESIEIAFKNYEKYRKNTIESNIKIEKKESVLSNEEKLEEPSSKKNKTWHNLLDEIFSEALSRRTSDIHIEPQEKTSIIRLRIDWELNKFKKINK